MTRSFHRSTLLGRYPPAPIAAASAALRRLQYGMLVRALAATDRPARPRPVRRSWPGCPRAVGVGTRSGGRTCPAGRYRPHRTRPASALSIPSAPSSSDSASSAGSTSSSGSSSRSPTPSSPARGASFEGLTPAVAARAAAWNAVGSAGVGSTAGGRGHTATAESASAAVRAVMACSVQARGLAATSSALIFSRLWLDSSVRLPTGPRPRAEASASVQGRLASAAFSRYRTRVRLPRVWISVSREHGRGRVRAGGPVLAPGQRHHVLDGEVAFAGGALALLGAALVLDRLQQHPQPGPQRPGVDGRAGQRLADARHRSATPATRPAGRPGTPRSSRRPGPARPRRAP